MDLFSPSGFRDVVSGRRRGLGASVLRGMLAAVEPCYTAAVTWRNRRYDAGRGVQRVGVPVISVGNLTLGGTGKTPMVEWIARRLAERGKRVVLVSRGYGAAQADAAGNDEARELAQKLPGVPHLQNPDRVAAARQAIETLAAEVLLLDDGFQHRRLARDLDLVMLDALEPFGFGRVFPRGTLREPLAGLRRAHVVVLSRADMLAPPERAAIRDQAARYAPQATWVETCHGPRGLLAADGTFEPLAKYKDCRVGAFCGIGNPAGFRHTLENCGYQVVAFREFPDHHAYTPEDRRSLADWTARHAATAILCTQKDLVKLGVCEVNGCPLRAVAIGLDFLGGMEEMDKRIASAVS